MLYGMEHFLLEREASAEHWGICFACRVSKGVTVGEGRARSIAVIITIKNSNKTHQRWKCYPPPASNVTLRTECYLPPAPNAPSLRAELLVVVVVNSLKFFPGNCWNLAGILILGFSKAWGFVCYTLSFKLSDKSHKSLCLFATCSPGNWHWNFLHIWHMVALNTRAVQWCTWPRAFCGSTEWFTEKCITYRKGDDMTGVSLSPIARVTFDRYA